MAIPTKITDHVEAAFARLISQFRSTRPVLHGLIRSFAEGHQRLENAAWEVLHKRLLDPAPGESTGAEGVQLDTLGAIVGLSRAGLADTAYRDAIRLRIKVNRSRGSNEDLIEILRLAMPSPKAFSYEDLWHQASYTYVNDISVSLAGVVLDALSRARAAGHRAILEYNTDRVASANLFLWADESAGGAGGFSDDGDPASGGLHTSMQG